MYAVVKFIDESDAPGIVCTHWIYGNENMSLYPNVKTNEARDRLLIKQATPTEAWSSCHIKILHKYSSFSEAIGHLRQAEETSNLESEGEEEFICNRPRKKNKKIPKYPGEESDEEVAPLPSKNTDSIPYPVPPTPQSSRSLNPSQSFQIESFQPCSPPSSYSYPSNFQATQNPANSDKAPACSSSQIIINGKLVAWMADISSQVKRLECKMDLILQNQAQVLLQQHQDIQNDDEDFEVLGSLPVSDDEMFIELNKKISMESRLRHALIKVFISLGGKDMRYHIYNMLKRVLSDEVAEMYTMSGKSTLKNVLKKPFLSTEVSKLIFSACRKVYKDMATEVKVREAFSDWLNQAKVRKIRRMQRHERDMEKNTE